MEIVNPKNPRTVAASATVLKTVASLPKRSTRLGDRGELERGVGAGVIAAFLYSKKAQFGDLHDVKGF